MAKVSFSEEDRLKAQSSTGVMIAFAIDARNCPDFADKRYEVGGVYDAERAAGLVDLVREYLRKTKPTT
jgi:hypothetical protein